MLTARRKLCRGGANRPNGVYEITSAGAVLISCHCRVGDRYGDLFLRFQLGGVNGLGIQAKRGGHLGVAEQFLNRLYVFAPASQKRRKAMAKIVESEPLTGFQPGATL